MINLNPFSNENSNWSNLLDDVYTSNIDYFVEEFVNPVWYNSGDWRISNGDPSYIIRTSSDGTNFYIESVKDSFYVVHSLDSNQFVSEYRMKLTRPEKLFGRFFYNDIFLDQQVLNGYTIGLELYRRYPPYEIRAYLYDIRDQRLYRFKRGRPQKINCDVKEWFYVKIEASVIDRVLKLNVIINDVSIISYSRRRHITQHGHSGFWLNRPNVALDSIMISDSDDITVL